jgi:hypothetical protein
MVATSRLGDVMVVTSRLGDVMVAVCRLGDVNRFFANFGYLVNKSVWTDVNCSDSRFSPM